ncbi:MAG: 2-C-methyl-D-erythritol 4-phosphate cytidylyltransferase [Candidatus Omnitrophota bacterium]
MYTCAIVVAAGKGARLRSAVSKPLVRLGQKPVLLYSLQTLSECPRIKAVVVVANRSNRQAIKRMISAYGLSKVIGIVEGGERRQDSVISGLKALPKQCDYVFIHDAARPLIDTASLERLIKGVQKTGAAIPGVPVKSTIKEVQRSGGSGASRVIRTLDRGRLWEIQTPQAFKKSIIMKAYDSFGMIEVTDDSALVEKLGVPVSLIMGSYENMKITTPEDLCMAAALLKERNAR